jgi:hypothetical protein
MSFRSWRWLWPMALQIRGTSRGRSSAIQEEASMSSPATGPAPGNPQVALERLDTEFDRDDFATMLTVDDGCPPRLTIASRHCPLSEDVLVEGQLYWFGWGEPIASVEDPAGAAAKIARVLRAVPEPSHG